jgi:hypothetical protein
MNNQQTAVEWFEEEYMKGNIILPILFHQAKKMEKDQMSGVYDKAFAEGLIFAKDIEHKLITFEEYYNEKYGK